MEDYIIRLNCHFSEPLKEGTEEKGLTEFQQIWKASQVAQWLKNKKRLPIKETRVPSLSWEDPLEKEMATCSSILAWEIPWTEEPGGLLLSN